MVIQARGSNCAGDDMIRKWTSATHIDYHSTTQYSDLLENLKTCLLYKCSKSVLVSPVGSNIGGRCGSQVHFLPLRRHIFSWRFVWTVAVPEVLGIVYCCTKSGRGVSADSDDREAGTHVSRWQVITVDSLFTTKHLSLPQGTSIVTVAWFAVGPCPNLACPPRFEEQEEK